MINSINGMDSWKVILKNKLLEVSKVLKRRKRKKIRFNRYTFQSIILTFVALFAYKISSSGGLTAVMNSGVFENREVTSDLEVHFIDVGQGDSVLLVCDGASMLIDAGENSCGTKVADYVKYNGIDKLDFVVATHPDSDHIGGIDTVLKEIPCDTVIMTDDSKDTMTYEEVEDIIDKKNISVERPVPKQTYELGCATVMIIGPIEEREDFNNNSVALLVKHGEEKFLFAGDAENEQLQDIAGLDVEIDADVYKVAHHGSSTSVNDEFLNKVSPDFAVISCGEGNEYGHPHSEVLNYLRTNGIATFRTDEQGTIVAISDGEGITWNCSPSESWLTGR